MDTTQVEAFFRECDFAPHLLVSIALVVEAVRVVPDFGLILNAALAFCEHELELERGEDGQGMAVH